MYMKCQVDRRQAGVRTVPSSAVRAGMFMQNIEMMPEGRHLP